MPVRSSSREETSTFSGSSSASASLAAMASRRSGSGVPSGSSLWGGMAAGTMSSLSRPSTATAVRAAARCPKWGGLKVPPKIPIFNGNTAFADFLQSLPPSRGKVAFAKQMTDEGAGVRSTAFPPRPLISQPSADSFPPEGGSLFPKSGAASSPVPAQSYPFCPSYGLDEITRILFRSPGQFRSG